MGLNIIETPEFFSRVGALGTLFPDERCFSFNHRANHYGRGKWICMLTLKPFLATILDIYVIRVVI